MRMMTAGLMALALAAYAAPAGAQAPCEAFQREIAESFDEASRATAEKLFPGRSAIQVAQLDGAISSSLALARLNLDLMAAAKCPLPSTPVRLTSYYPVAKRCLSVGGDENCQRKNWKPEP